MFNIKKKYFFINKPVKIPNEFTIVSSIILLSIYLEYLFNLFSINSKRNPIIIK